MALKKKRLEEERKEKRLEEEREEKNLAEEREKKILRIQNLELNIPKRILQFLLSFPNQQEDVLGQIQEGIIPIGFSDDHLWPPMKNITNKLAEMLNQKGQDLQNIDKTIDDAKIELEELEIKKNQLQTIIRESTTKKEEINQQKQTLVDFIGLVDNKDDFFETMIQQEANIVQTAENDFKNKEGDPNLQVIFNCYGISSQTIKSFKNVSFNQFLNDDTLTLCEEKNIQNAEDKLDIGYVHYMLFNHKLPNQEHIQECNVCICESPQELLNLLREFDERDFGQLDLNFLDTYCMNGPRIISTVFSQEESIQRIFPTLSNNKIEQLISANDLLQMLHVCDEI